MASTTVIGKGTANDPWVLKTPPGTSEYKMYRDESSNPPALVCIVGTTRLSYHLRCLEDLHEMLKKHGDWMLLGSADEQKPAAEGTVEAWARSSNNPVGGWYGLKNGLRGRFAMYIPPLMEALNLAEVEHNAKNNRMRAIMGIEFEVSEVIPAIPEIIYTAWLSSKEHSKMTGSPAQVSAKIGEPFEAWDGYIQGKNLELEPPRRILQLWRTSEFENSDKDSRLEILFVSEGDGTRVTIRHSDLPDHGMQYRQGWIDAYFVPMMAYFGKKSE